MPSPLPSVPLLSYGIDCTEDFNTVEEINFGDNYSQRVTRGINPIRQTWRLVYENVTSAHKEVLRSFFNGLKGTDYLTWTPTGQATNLKFVTKGPVKSKPTGADLWNVDVEIRQVFDA